MISSTCWPNSFSNILSSPQMRRTTSTCVASQIVNTKVSGLLRASRPEVRVNYHMRASNGLEGHSRRPHRRHVITHKGRLLGFGAEISRRLFPRIELRSERQCGPKTTEFRCTTQKGWVSRETVKIRGAGMIENDRVRCPRRVHLLGRGLSSPTDVAIAARTSTYTPYIFPGRDHATNSYNKLVSCRKYQDVWRT